MPLPTSYFTNTAIRSRKRGGRRLYPVSIMKQSWTDPIAADDDGYSAAHAGAGAAGTTSQTLGGALTSGGVGSSAHPRNVVITVTHASSVVAMSGTITGTDINGDAQTEAWSVTATGTSKVFTGAKSFKTITSITEVVAADASANTIKSGTGTKFGLESPLSVSSALKEVAAGSVVTNGTLVAAGSGTADPRGTYSPNTAPDGSNDYTIYYLSDDPGSDR